MTAVARAARYASLPFLYPSCISSSLPVRRAMMSAVRSRPDNQLHRPLSEAPPTVIPSSPSLSPDAAAPQVAARPPTAPKADKPRPTIRSTKAALTMVSTRALVLWHHFWFSYDHFHQTPKAVTRLRGLLKGPTPQLIRIGVRNKGCAGLSYHLEYVEQPGKFDEVVEQDGVRVLIDSKALFSIIGSEMDWTEDPLRCVCHGVSFRAFVLIMYAVPDFHSRTRTLRMRAGAESRSPLGHDLSVIPVRSNLSHCITPSAADGRRI